MGKMELTVEQRQTLCGTRVWLDGKPAGIAGWRNSFASVRRMDGRGGSVEYAWPTVAHIVDNKGGRFSS